MAFEFGGKGDGKSSNFSDDEIFLNINIIIPFLDGAPSPK